MEAACVASIPVGPDIIHYNNSNRRFTNPERLMTTIMTQFLIANRLL